MFHNGGKKIFDEIFAEILARNMPIAALPKIGRGCSMLYLTAPALYSYLYAWIVLHDAHIPRITQDGRLIDAYLNTR